MDQNEDPSFENPSDEIWDPELEQFERECVDELQSEPDLEDRLQHEQSLRERQLFSNFQATATAIAQLYRDRHHPVWLPFQNAAITLTNMYKECALRNHQSAELGQQAGRYRRTKEVVAWLQKRKRRTVGREEILAFLCGKTPPPPPARLEKRHGRVSRDSNQMIPLHCPQDRNSLIAFPHSVESADDDSEHNFVQFQNALGRGDPVANVSVMDYRSNNSSARQDLHSFIAEEAYRNKDLRKRPAQIQDYDPATRKRARFL